MTLADELYTRTLLNDFGVSVGESDLAYQQDHFTGDGATTVFNLSQLPSSLYPTFVYFGSVLQNSGYSISTNQITFSAAPAFGVDITFVYSY
jgi:hypothetical protein